MSVATRLDDVIAGTISLAALSAGAQRAANAELDRRIRAHAAATSYGAVLEREDVETVSLADGQLVRHPPEPSGN